jgi:hypothetical protein
MVKRILVTSVADEEAVDARALEGDAGQREA